MKCYIKDYPRPQFVRTDWENLNGTWDFGFDDENAGEKEKWYQEFKGDKKINVPFTYETKLSGIQDETRHDFIWYHRTINVDGVKLENNRYILHFEGSDFITKVWVNGAYAGSHRGGYARCSFDVTNLVHDGENELTVKVEDSLIPSSQEENSDGSTKTLDAGMYRPPVSGKRYGVNTYRRSAWHP